MTRQERFDFFMKYFSEHMPDAATELKYHDPYQLIVAVILSAQCTDKRVNMLTPRFFEKFPEVEDLARGTSEEVFEIIKSCSYPNNKTKHLLGMARMLLEHYHGVVPSDIIELQNLPGIGRKSANVIAAVVYDMPVIAVDTHVFRVARRIGLTVNAKTPLQTELQLSRYLPAEKRVLAHHWLILHGRYVCQARRPRCEECGLREVCKYYASLKRVA